MDEDQLFEKLRRRLWNLELEHPLVMGAGVAKYVSGPEGLEGFLASANASLLIGGSFTVDPRAGNSGEVCWSSADGGLTLNRMGLPNRGMVELTEHLPTLMASARRQGKPIGISVAGGAFDGACTLEAGEQFALLAQTAFGAGVDLVELNCSCPNTESDIIAFCPEEIRAILDHLERVLDPALHNVCLKVSPYSQGTLLREVARLVDRSPLVKGVSTSNTFPNALYLEDGRPVISSNDGLAGLSGPCLLPIALGQVVQWRRHLDPAKYLLGGGGVTTVRDVLAMLQAGADAVFLVSAVINRKPRIFNELLEGLIEHYSRD